MEYDIEIIGMRSKTMFRFCCYCEGGDGERNCSFVVNGSGDRSEMVRLHNLLLDNGFHISGVESSDNDVPIINRVCRGVANHE